MTALVQTIEQLVIRFYDDLWNRWDDAMVDGVLADDFAFRGSLGTETRGRDGWRAYRDAIRHSSPDFHNEVIELIAADDRAAARLRYTGHHKASILGVPPTGRHFEYFGAAFFTSEAGRLSSAWVIGDLDSLRRQLGREC